VQGLLVLLIYAAFHAYQTRSLAEGAAPGMNAQLVSGDAAVLESAPGEVVVVHFWATWCGVCQAEEGNVDSVASDTKLITVASRSGAAPQVADYLRERSLSFDAVADPGGDIARQWGVQAFPTTFVIAPDGTVASRTVGYTTTLGLWARIWLAAL
jgi:thiol-disulfide isomerase/thioredoxin